MPNWCGAGWDVTLPKEKADRFLNYFLDGQNDNSSVNLNRLKGKLLYRTFIYPDTIKKIDVDNILCKLSFYSDTAWSMDVIVYPPDCSDKDSAGVNHVVSLEDVCKDCGVTTLQINAEELNEGFRQDIRYDPATGVSFDQHDIETKTCDDCGDFWVTEDYPNATHCPSCGSKNINGGEE